MTNIGQFELSSVIESQGPFLELQSFFPDAEMDVVEANRDWLMPRYVEPTRTVLAETCSINWTCHI